MNTETMTKEQLAGMIDHTFLKAFATHSDFDRLCSEAKENHFAMVAINSSPVRYCKALLRGTDVHVGAAISFPLGQTDIETKLFETRKAIEDGADEIDYVLNIGELKMGNERYIREEMERITEACRLKGVLCKVIFENCYLTKEEIKKAAEIASIVKPDFIKTSTGFGTAGALAEDVALMKEIAGSDVKVKAAGGIRDWNTCKKMIDSGAERIGTSAGVEILKQFLKEREEK
ncbi:MAG: deoxyribose-phosphate aldolase [Lachnospiraceae bacterium]|nr:deoxyribose-phosphate aldolase [Lachnospiraceae bacterium]